VEVRVQNSLRYKGIKEVKKDGKKQRNMKGYGLMSIQKT
jgi:hypothetical protein